MIVFVISGLFYNNLKTKAMEYYLKYELPDDGAIYIEETSDKNKIKNYYTQIERWIVDAKNGIDHNHTGWSAVLYMYQSEPQIDPLTGKLSNWVRQNAHNTDDGFEGKEYEVSLFKDKIIKEYGQELYDKLEKGGFKFQVISGQSHLDYRVYDRDSRIEYTEPKVGDKAYLYYENKINVYLHYFDTGETPDPDPEPEPEPEPPNIPPVPIINAPDKVNVGQKFCIRSDSYDPDGYLVLYDWYYAGELPVNDEVGWTTETTVKCGLQLMEKGEYEVWLQVTDNRGSSRDTTHTIVATEPTPVADFEVTGTLKENRKIQLEPEHPYGDNDVLKAFPLTEDKWTITAPRSCGNDSIKTVQNISGNMEEVAQTIDLLVKCAGEYKISHYVKNNIGNEDSAEMTINVIKDVEPVADFVTTTVVYRDKDSEKATIKLTDESFSTDDIISNRKWTVRYDSDNDGRYDDEDLVVISDTNERTVNYVTSKVGKYLFELETFEEFAQPTIEQFVDLSLNKETTDRRFHNTTTPNPYEENSIKPLSEKEVEVDNVAPHVTLKADTKKQIEVYVNMEDISANYSKEQVESVLNQHMKSKLISENYDVNIRVAKNEALNPSIVPLIREVSDDDDDFMYPYYMLIDENNYQTEINKVPVESYISLPSLKVDYSNNIYFKYHNRRMKQTIFKYDTTKKELIDSNISAYSYVVGPDNRLYVPKKIDKGQHPEYSWGKLTSYEIVAYDTETWESEVVFTIDGHNDSFDLTGNMLIRGIIGDYFVYTIVSSGSFFYHDTFIYNTETGEKVEMYPNFSTSYSGLGAMQFAIVDDKEILYSDHWNQSYVIDELMPSVTGRDYMRYGGREDRESDRQFKGHYLQIPMANGKYITTDYVNNIKNMFIYDLTDHSTSPIKVSANTFNETEGAVATTVDKEGNIYFVKKVYGSWDVPSTVTIYKYNPYLNVSTQVNKAIDDFNVRYLTSRYPGDYNPYPTINYEGRDLSSIIEEIEWKSDTSQKFFINISDDEIQGLPEQTNEVASQLNAYNIHYVSIDTSNTASLSEAVMEQLELDNYQQTVSSINNTTVTNATKNITNFIIDVMNKMNNSSINIFVGVDGINHNTTLLNNKVNSIIKSKLNEYGFTVNVTVGNLKTQNVNGRNVKKFNYNEYLNLGKVFNILIKDDPLTTINQTHMVGQTLTSKGYLIGLGKSTSETSILSAIEKNMNKGVYYDNTNMDQALNDTADYILDILLKDIGELYVIQGETEVLYGTTYSDYESDPIFTDNWKYTHDYSVFENNQGKDASVGGILDSYVSIFNKVGRYQPTYTAQDNPLRNLFSSDVINNFTDYRKWATANNVHIYSHRMPIPEFRINFNPETKEYSVTNAAYDLDKRSIDIGYGGGIAKQSFSWRIQGEYGWKEGLPSSPLSNAIYEIKSDVLDFQGQSTYEIRLINATSPSAPPVADFDPNPALIEVGETVNFINKSYEPTGEDLIGKWYYKKSTSGTYTLFATGNLTSGEPNTNWNPTTDLLISIGLYDIKLIVTDEEGLSDEVIKQVEVVEKSNTPPIPGFTVQNVYVGSKIEVKSTATDPDGDTLTYSYQIKTPTHEFTINSTGKDHHGNNVVIESNGNMKLQTYDLNDVGIWQITQIISDGTESVSYGPVDVQVLPLILEGYVTHTEKWTEIHNSLGHAPDEFYSGEKFVLNSIVSDYPIQSLTVDINGELETNELFNARLTLNKESNTNYLGEYFDTRFSEPGTMIKEDSIVTFRFNVTYINGFEPEEVVVNVKIIGNVFDYLNQMYHRSY